LLVESRPTVLVLGGALFFGSACIQNWSRCGIVDIPLQDEMCGVLTIQHIHGILALELAL
jgi:hypothetical protein